MDCRLAIASVLLIFCAVVSLRAQTTPEKVLTGSVSGKVTVKNRGVAGVVVFVEEQDYRNSSRSSYRGTTDQTGSYRITNIPAGTYTIAPVAPSLAFENEPTNNSIVVGEGDTIENVNFSMVLGGVITGKVTDADGKPLIEAFVSMSPIDSTLISARESDTVRTDDRGIYRAFGLPPGKYRVYVGQSGSLPGDEIISYRQTYYPSVTNIAKATLIEVTEGSETTNVDIVVGRALPAFKVAGRILDAETGKPLPGIKYGVFRSYEYGGSSSVGQNFTDAKGEFRFDNVAPGKYAVFIVSEESGVRPDSVSFEVVDRDVVDLVIKAGKAASLSGVVVFEGADETAIKPNDFLISAWARSNEEYFGGGGKPQSLNPDGSFRIGGLRKGSVRFRLTFREPSYTKQVALLRVERDGVVQPLGLFLKDGEQVTGLRLVFRYLTGAIQGQLKVEGDEPLPNSRISVWVSLTDPVRADDYYGGSSPQLDARKRFVVNGLAAGTYEVNVAVFEPGRQDTTKIYKQEVTVTDNAVSEITIVIKKP